MIFFTRKLYEGYQPDSGWEHQALNTWYKLGAIYQDYRKVIEPLVPKSVVELDDLGMHDARVISCSQKNGKLTLVLDSGNAIPKWGGGLATLRFTGIKNRIRTASLHGQYWKYSEVHLASSTRFSLHVMFDESDIQIDADDVIVKTVPRH